MNTSLLFQRVSSFSFVSLLVFGLGATKSSYAEVHADASLALGVHKRFDSRPVTSPLNGVAFDLSSHVALFPLVRLGFGAHYDAAEARHLSLNHYVSAGPEVRVFYPFRSLTRKAWLQTGVSYGRVFTKTYLPSADFSVGFGDLTQVSAQTVSGGYFEVPLYLGGSQKLSRKVEVFAQGGVRFGFGAHGSFYDYPSLGKQMFGLGLQLGVMLEL